MEEKRKLRVGFVSNCPVGGKTGLSRDMRCLTTELYKKNKYEIFFLAQQMQDNDPSFQKLPFKCEGAFKNFDQQRFNSDPAYQRFVAYSNTAVESFVVNNKLDCLIISDDIWAFDVNSYLKTDWYKHLKENVLAKITADSEPILSMIKEWAQECPNFYVWTEFAERALKEEDSKKYGHVKTLHGSINSNEFYPLPKEQKLQLRKNFGIQDDEKICLYLGRNQLRKTAIWANQEALAVFKKKYPNKKLRLLFHMNFSEPGGWPIDQIRDELKLNKEDLLCTYYCRGCGTWNIQPHDGEDLDCPVCQGKKTRITAGVGSTITEEDLNKIYNICDFACSNFTSGGLEYFNLESLLAGLPLACTPYSSGETFTKNDFVFPIKSVFTREVGTGFRKAAPVIDSIVEFYNYAYDMNEIKRQRITEKGRQWAIDNFDGKIIAEKLEKFLDSRQPIDWDIYHNRKKELKNVQAQIEDKQTDEEFTLECYTKILNNPSVKENDSNGYNHWLNFLRQPKDKGQLKNEMVNVFRNAAQEHNNKVQKPTDFKDLLLNNGKKHFLIVCPESAGDCLYVSATLKSFRESYPENEWNLYLGVKPEFMELFDCNSYLNKILPFQDFMNNEIACLGQSTNPGIFQGYCFITAGSQRFLNYLGNHNINLQLQ